MDEVNDKERYIMNEIMEFPNREEFREWLREHCVSNDGMAFVRQGWWAKNFKSRRSLGRSTLFWLD